MEEEFGYDQARFEGQINPMFECMICCCIVKDPKECQGCGSLYCNPCIQSWQKKNKQCPNRCTNTHITPITKALQRMYNDLNIKCQFFEKCKKICKMSDLEAHESKCNKPPCKNMAVCEQNVSAEFKNQQVCSLPCLLMSQLNNQNNKKECLKIIKNFLDQNIKQAVVQQPRMDIEQNQLGGQQVQPQQGGNIIKWSTTQKGQFIQVSQDGSQVWLKENGYIFRTIIADKPFYGGMHYWEIHADPRTENELKIGVATKQDFNFNSAFCDYEYGFSFYGLGQLRHNSNASGPQYGKRFKKEGVLGCFLNMNKGQLSFALNGQFMGIAFNSQKLKNGPIVIAVSLLHCAGCKLQYKEQIPAYFPQ